MLTMQLLISLVTDVEETVVTSVIFSLLSKYFSPQLKSLPFHVW